ncbi:hypothetical protein [Engelhardtia mirabilis]|uniref:Transposase n=1 Tax=Engelhardtia mirabilis TaxID=2528011 RepID=A0A518BF41_9BACT|nr:hypothetical protein Pla133_05780 [Planctomycetes bacterium Pla133]QDU99839.1 hypothetical protein Pla86_05780 [Planctomycetes bacterium Pla86]
MEPLSLDPQPHQSARTLENFVPQQCPWSDCPSQTGAIDFRFRSKGYFDRACDGRRVPRFHCSICNHGFSAQTFRVDYRLKRPDRLWRHFEHFISKVTMRQSTRLTGSKLDTVARHQRLLGEHCRALQQALLRRARDLGRGPKTVRIAFDELETFEVDRLEQPVTVAVVVDAKTLFIHETEVGPLASRPSARSRRKLPSDSQVPGDGAAEGQPRRCGSRRTVRAALRRTADWLSTATSVTAVSDMKATYPCALRSAFGDHLVKHVRVRSTSPRTNRNPLFPANLTLAMLRDGVSRLVRRSWAHSKRRGRLRLHLWIWIAWRNWCRERVVGSRRTTAAMASTFADAPLSIDQLLGFHGRFEELAGLA